MAKILIRNLFGKMIEVQDRSRTLLQHFHDNRIDWMHACGGKGRCTSCKVIVEQGMENLGDLSVPEQRYRQNNGLKSNERLSCQSKPIGDIVVSAPAFYKLPHVAYSD
ncbi:2Fe-2S iron-sulfur cluster-binding protein [Chryseosolibacter indicus]|uniref:(2Fe-2S)-binding protein n=1 Tax=Chryseosolibacter indicus TaxID=2782351 RepID=A0ABS5VT00_9BACT|nr:2Fe-2S iron-sulfur cluster-binding protein [Chryseosolibacter indicus]MBT1704560.1 (2Fe-2S)-binding protein [Chryseosolibacter indicus]